MCACVHIIKHYMNVHMYIFLKIIKIINMHRSGIKHHPEETTAKLFTFVTSTWVVPNFSKLRQKELKSKSVGAI